MTLDTVTQPHKLFAHLLQPVLRDWALGSLRLLARFHHVFLCLENPQPSMVKIIPQLDSIAVQALVVRGETYCIVFLSGQRARIYERTILTYLILRHGTGASPRH